MSEHTLEPGQHGPLPPTPGPAYPPAAQPLAGIASTPNDTVGAGIVGASTGTIAVSAVSGWHWWWLAWLAAGLAVELVALLRKPYGDTLSEFVWSWLHVTPGKTTIRTAVMSFRTLLVVVFLGWLIPHFALGWFT